MTTMTHTLRRFFMLTLAVMAVMTAPAAIAAQDVAQQNPAQKFASKLNEFTAKVGTCETVDQITKLSEEIDADGYSDEDKAYVLTDADKDMLADAMVEMTIATSSRVSQLTGQPNPITGLAKEQIKAQFKPMIDNMKTLGQFMGK